MINFIHKNNAIASSCHCLGRLKFCTLLLMSVVISLKHGLSSSHKCEYMPFCLFYLRPPLVHAVRIWAPHQLGSSSPSIIQWFSFLIVIIWGKYKLYVHFLHNNPSSVNSLHCLKLKETLYCLFWFGWNTNWWLSLHQAWFL